ncbi:MAG: tetratricopeptide repeat protein [Blastocatellia bacterium]
MRQATLTLRVAALLLGLLLPVMVWAQAPPSIQFFMPDGSLPDRQLRFTLTTDNGSVVDIFFTDTKGRFLVTRSVGLRPENGFTITVESDGLTFGTTMYQHRTHGVPTVYYIAVFLKRLESAPTTPPGTIAVSELDVRVPKEARDAYDAAMRCLRSGQADEAVNQFRRALKIYPKYFRALNDLGALLMKMSRLDEAAETLERAAVIAPHVYHPRLSLAIIRTRQSKYKQAIELLEQLHKENPKLNDVRVALADALMAVGRLDNAEPHLRTVLSDTKLDLEAEGDAHYKLGLLLNRKEQFQEAVQHLTAAAKILPNSARTHLQLGGALLQLERRSEAEEELLAAYQLGGREMGAAQFLLGQVYFLSKKYESAMRAFEQYLADVPRAPNIPEVRALIDKIKGALNQK